MKLLTECWIGSPLYWATAGANEPMPELPHEELRRLTTGLKEFINYQRRLGLQLIEGKCLVEKIFKPVTPESIPEPTEMISLAEIRKEMDDCRRCKLWKTRTLLVFGVGNPEARLMFIGEAPGAEEDQQGEPFVGEAGKLFNRILNKMEISRQEVYITNVVKSRPPRNRNPEAEEIAACRPFLLKQIQAIRPRIIVTLGAVATHALLETKDPLNRLRGHWQQWRGFAVMPTYHPSYLLRVPQDRIKTWEDMQKVLVAYRSQQEQ
jgi:uracil-DNA glycosylase family 4